MVKGDYEPTYKSKMEKRADRVAEKIYRDPDLYDWSGRQTDKGSEVRRKGGGWA
jgi:hypothetical protein